MPCLCEPKCAICTCDKTKPFKPLSTNPMQPYDPLYEQRLESSLDTFRDTLRKQYRSHFGMELGQVGISKIVTRFEEFMRM